MKKKIVNYLNDFCISKGDIKTFYFELYNGCYIEMINKNQHDINSELYTKETVLFHIMHYIKRDFL